MNEKAILALISDLYSQIVALQTENTRLKEELKDRDNVE